MNKKHIPIIQDNLQKLLLNLPKNDHKPTGFNVAEPTLCHRLALDSMLETIFFVVSLAGLFDLKPELPGLAI